MLVSVGSRTLLLEHLKPRRGVSIVLKKHSERESAQSAKAQKALSIEPQNRCVMTTKSGVSSNASQGGR